jgi:hypothetical protein
VPNFIKTSGGVVLVSKLAVEPELGRVLVVLSFEAHRVCIFLSELAWVKRLVVVFIITGFQLLPLDRDSEAIGASVGLSDEVGSVCVQVGDW